MCEEIVPMSKLLAASTVAALAIAVAGCSESTAPTKSTPRTVSVVTTASVPAVPTAPVTLTTSATESKVAVTYPLAALQAIVQSLGGPVTITMTDVASKDFAARLPAATTALIDQSKAASVLVFSAQRSGASLAQATDGTILSQTFPSGFYSVEFAFTPFGGSCASGSLALYINSGGTKTAIALQNVTIAGSPQVIKGFAGIPANIIAAWTGWFECTPVSGAFNP
jgi:hypothetical protein